MEQPTGRSKSENFLNGIDAWCTIEEGTQKLGAQNSVIP